MEINLGNTEIVIVAAQNNFRDEELFVPENMFSAAGAYVLIASNEDDEPMMGMVGGSARANIEIEDIDVDGLDALVIAGGTGSIEYLWDDEKLRNKVRKAYDKGKIIGAICLSGVVLARAGILEGKRATVCPTAETMHEFKRHKAEYVDNGVVVTGRIVTAQGPFNVYDFATAILDLIKAEVVPAKH